MALDKSWVLAAVVLTALCGLELAHRPPPKAPPISVAPSSEGELRVRLLESGDQVPGFVGRSFLDGEEHEVASRGEQKSLVFILAENCPECRTNVARWNAMRRAAEGHVRVLGLAVGKFQQVRALMAESGVEFEVLRFASAELMQAYGAVRFPQTLLIGGDGVVEEVVVGPLDEQRTEAILQAALASERRQAAREPGT